MSGRIRRIDFIVSLGLIVFCLVKFRPQKSCINACEMMAKRNSKMIFDLLLVTEMEGPTSLPRRPSSA
jgi:hypothetical protein